jgi:hypothetical protein
MRSTILMAGVALAVAAAGAACAAPHKMRSDGAAVASPAQPVPYGMMDAYMKASPKARSAMLANASSPAMQSDASTMAPASAMTSETPAAGASSSPSTESTMGSSSAGAGMQSGAVNPTPAMPPATASGAPANDSSTGKQ